MGGRFPPSAGPAESTATTHRGYSLPPGPPRPFRKKGAAEGPAGAGHSAGHCDWVWIRSEVGPQVGAARELSLEVRGQRRPVHVQL